MRAEQLTDPVAYHGEGPVWWEGWGGLRWVDMLAGDILSLASNGSVERKHVGTVAAALRPRRKGGAVIAVERGFALEDSDGGVTLLDEIWTADTGVRMNEGSCDPDGRFYCGSMAYDKRSGAGKLFRLDQDHSVSVVLENVTVSNGLEWSPDGSHAYYNDTPTQRVAVFDYDVNGGLSDMRTFVEIPDGRPDGLTVDEEGGVWVALIRSGIVRRYSPSGNLDETIEVDAKKVTACTFGGEDLSELYITTSRENVDPGEDPLAGALFVAKPGVNGLRARTFAG